MTVKISIIVAHDDKLGIGARNRLLWHISKELKRFKALTMNHPIIMGRKTFQSIGRPLAGRTNIIITRDPDFTAAGCRVVNSLAAGLQLAKTLDDQEIFIIGGSEIYRQAMEQDLVDKLYVTHVQGDFNAEVFFPDYSHFTLVSRQGDQEGDYRFTYLELVR